MSSESDLHRLYRAHIDLKLHLPSETQPEEPPVAAQPWGAAERLWGSAQQNGVWSPGWDYLVASERGLQENGP